MYLKFIGVGEAFDPEKGTSCYLLKSNRKTLLIDCGYACLAELHASVNSVDEIDAIYFTHFHADHLFGIVPLLAAWKAWGRSAPLTLIGQPGIKNRIIALMELGYPGSYEKLVFPIEYIETTDPVALDGNKLAFAASDHSLENYAVKISSGDQSIGFSGDGALNERTKALFQDCRYLVHEAFGMETAIEGHTTAKEVIQFARTLPFLQSLALVHIQKDERTKRLEEFKQLGSGESFEIYLPEPGSVLPIRS